MDKKTTQIVFFIIFIAFLFVLSFFIFKPYLGVIFLSSIFAVAFYPVYEKILFKWQNKSASFASAITTLLFVFCIVVPLIFLSKSLLSETINLYNSIILDGSSTELVSRLNLSINRLADLFPAGIMDQEINVQNYASGVLNWIIKHFNSIFSAIFDGLFKFVLMLITFYYLLINGQNIKRAILSFSPIADTYDEDFIKTLRLSIDAVLQGRILVSLAQGFFLGLGFVIFGIANPILWGFVGSIASMIPFLGTSIITIFASAYLFLSGNIAQGIGMIVWGAVCVGLVDNVLSFFFFKNKINVHPLIVLFSIIGGIELFGMIGFLVGPIAVSALMILFRLHPLIFRVKNN